MYQAVAATVSSKEKHDDVAPTPKVPLKLKFKRVGSAATESVVVAATDATEV